jgi:glycosyltransferase involved in cell wall biosynthesis
VAAVAVIRPQKRLDRLIEAAALLRDEFPLIRVLIVGAGYPDETVKLESLVEKRGLGEIVRFLGERSDAADVMAASDIGVITSDYEGIPLSLLEFMALRRPVVATAVGGIPEVLEGRHAGILVETLTPEAVAAAVKEIAQLSPAEREVMGDRGRLLQQQRFSFAAYLRSVEELYERLVPDRISGDRRA